MPRSLANGDYSLVRVIESTSGANSWYRVLTDRRTGNLSCDCPAWTFNQGRGQVRTCKRTRVAQLLTTGRTDANRGAQSDPVSEEHPLISATRQQWPGLGGLWSLEQRRSTIDHIPYQFVLLRLA